MTTSRLTPQPALTAHERLASDHLLDELLLELTGDTVVGLDRYRADALTPSDAALQTASRRASA